MLWRNGCDGKILRCGAGDRHQHCVNEKLRHGGMTALHHAAGHGNERRAGGHKDGIRSEIVKLLLDRCQDKGDLMAMQCYRSRDTALHLASWHNVRKTHDVLKSMGAPSDLRNKMGEHGSYHLDAAEMGAHPRSPGFRDGMVIRICNTSSREFLLQDGCHLLTKPFDRNGGDLRYIWTLEHTQDGIFAIKCSASGCFLDGAKRCPRKVCLASGERNPRSDKYLQWILVDMGDGKHAIKSLSSGSYLNGGADSDENDHVFKGAPKPRPTMRRTNPLRHPGLQWEISEVSR